MVYLEGYYLVSKYVQIYADFPDMFPALISNLNPCGQRTTLYDLNSFEFIHICPMTQHMVYLDECPTCPWKELYSAWGGEFYSYWVRSS